MGGERGQASVEWVGTVLATALVLAALGRLAGHADATEIATAGLRETACAVAGCPARERRESERVAETSHIGTELRHAGWGGPLTAVTAPPLLPPPALGGDRPGPVRPRPARPRPARPRLPPGGGSVLTSARARAGTLWRRAWLACFGYERVRYGLLHPESRPRQTVPLSAIPQMVNDCLSPFDFARDWEHLRPR